MAKKKSKNPEKIKQTPEQLVLDYILHPDRLGRPFREVDIIEGLGEVGQGKSKLLSRNAIREALSRLIGRGVCTSVRRYGTQLVVPLEREVVCMFEIREHIELLAYLAIIADPNKQDVVNNRIEPILSEMSQVDKTPNKRGLLSYESLAEFNAIDVAFHAELLRIAEYEVVVHTIERFQMLGRIYSGGWLRTPKTWALVIKEHAAIVKCLTEIKPSAKATEKALKDHLATGRKKVLEGGRSTTG